VNEVIDRDEACTCDWVEYSNHHINVRVPDPACPVDHEPDPELERERDIEVHDVNFDQAEIDDTGSSTVEITFVAPRFLSDEARQSIVDRIYWALDDGNNEHYAGGVLQVRWIDG
jgi:hypothetical protein